MWRITVARTALGVSVTLACAAALSACHASNSTVPASGHSPVAVTRDFITDGMIDGNGFLACIYLTFEEQRAVSKRAGGVQCRQAFDTAQFKLGGYRVDTVYEVNHLRTEATANATRAHVRLSRGGDAAEFTLVKADAPELQEFLEPNTGWRIAKGALPFIPANSAD